MSGLAFGVLLYAGVAIPPGYADGLTYSVQSRAACVEMLADLPESPAKKMMKCIIKIKRDAIPIS
jgi:hypothetical protein